MSGTNLSKDKLIAYLIIDDIQVNEEILNKAKNNDRYSLFMIGSIYYSKQQYAKAIDWYHLSAAQNYPYAQFRLGHMYSTGKGVFTEYTLAMEWFLKAHINGHIEAANNIGALYGKGKGVPQSYENAMTWYLKAANKQSFSAQYNIGIYYEHGRGTKIDKLYALEWYQKSAAQGYKNAQQAIDRLNKEGYVITERQKGYLQVEKDKNEMESKIKLLEKEKRVSDEEKKYLKAENKLLEREIKVLKLEKHHNQKSQSVELFIKVDGAPITSVHSSVMNVTETIKEENQPENDI